MTFEQYWKEQRIVHKIVEGSVFELALRFYAEEAWKAAYTRGEMDGYDEGYDAGVAVSVSSSLA